MLDQEMYLLLADYGFMVFHSGLILFNLFAWMSPWLRKWHLICILLTLGSWFLLGIWHGWGYCPLTDWHWEVMRKRGIEDLPNSYISFLMDRLIGLSLPVKWVDKGTLLLTLWALGMSLWVNFKPQKTKR